VNTKLINAVLRQISKDRKYAKQCAVDAAHHGASAGWPGFTATRDCIQFAKKHRKLIVEHLVQWSESFDENVIVSMREWKYLKQWQVHELSIAAALTGGKWDEEQDGEVLEQLAWFALEEAGNALDY
jgi:hypothetical protein